MLKKNTQIKFRSKTKKSLHHRIGCKRNTLVGGFANMTWIFFTGIPQQTSRTPSRAQPHDPPTQRRPGATVNCYTFEKQALTYLPTTARVVMYGEGAVVGPVKKTPSSYLVGGVRVASIRMVRVLKVRNRSKKLNQGLANFEDLARSTRPRSEIIGSKR